MTRQDHQSRYAIYIAPKPETPLWQFGSKVLGYDAATGLDLSGFRLPSIDEAEWHKSTMRARVYGFHATLKAPFRLADGYNEQDLIAGLTQFSAGRTALAPIALHLSVLDDNDAGGFLAIIPLVANAALQALEAATVKDLDHFRAPLTEAEIAKRNPETLSGRQKNYLADFGYPYVLEEYRAHFTLSDRLPKAAKAVVELNDLMIGHIGAPAITIDELVLFKQSSPTSRFQIIARTPLGER